MSRGTQIIVSCEPGGRFDEGLISGTPKPGTLVEMMTTAPNSGRFTYRAITRSTGTKGPICILLEDDLQGKLGAGAVSSFGPRLPGDAYVTGTRCRVYYPIAGEEFNLIVADVAGTADDVAIADLFVGQTTTGKLVANSANAAIPFQAQEAVTDPTADYLLWVKFLGAQA